MKKITTLLCVFCMLLSALSRTEYDAAPAEWYTMYINCDGGTFEVQPGMNYFDTKQTLEEGKTLASYGKLTVKDPTCAGKQFLGWLGINSDTGETLNNGMFFTTQDVMDFSMPSHNVEFKAQWQGSTITAITYAALYPGTGDVDYNVKVTLINDGISYSGYGFVSIPESIYSTWTGTVQQIWEYPGEYINADYRYIADYFDAGMMSVAEFKKQKNLWQMMFKYAGEPEVFPPQSVIDNFWAYAAGVAPEVSIVNTTQAGNVISDTSIVPADYSITMNQYSSGDTYNKAVTAAQNAYGSNNVLVYNIDLKDTNSAPVHQLSGMVDVKLSVPADFTVQAGNKVVVYYLNEDGNLEECVTTYDDATKTVTFQTNHFSVYVVAEVANVVEETEAMESATEESKEMISSSNDKNAQELQEFGWIWILIIVAIVAVVVFVIVVKNKKSQ